MKPFSLRAFDLQNNEGQESKTDGEGRAGSQGADPGGFLQGLYAPPRLSNRHVDSVEEFSEMPSHPTSKEAQSQTVLGVTDKLNYPSQAINSPITIGDKVTIFDCPGHWGWASPFTVEAINGEAVKLEMVDEMLEIGRLEKWSK